MTATSDPVVDLTPDNETKKVKIRSFFVNIEKIHNFYSSSLPSQSSDRSNLQLSSTAVSSPETKITIQTSTTATETTTVVSVDEILYKIRALDNEICDRSAEIRQRTRALVNYYNSLGDACTAAQEEDIQEKWKQINVDFKECLRMYNEDLKELKKQYKAMQKSECLGCSII